MSSRTERPQRYRKKQDGEKKKRETERAKLYITWYKLFAEFYVHFIAFYLVLIYIFFFSVHDKELMLINMALLPMCGLQRIEFIHNKRLVCMTKPE